MKGLYYYYGLALLYYAGMSIGMGYEMKGATYKI